MYAISARPFVENRESAADLKNLAKGRGYELWEPSGKEFSVAQYSSILPIVPRLALDGLETVLTADLSPRTFGLLMY